MNCVSDWAVSRHVLRSVSCFDCVVMGGFGSGHGLSKSRDESVGGLTSLRSLQVPRLGCMLVGWGGNNGTTVSAATLANKLGLSWHTKEGEKVSGTHFLSVVRSCSM